MKKKRTTPVKYSFVTKSFITIKKFDIAIEIFTSRNCLLKIQKEIVTYNGQLRSFYTWTYKR